jgi:hypothetical protein
LIGRINFASLKVLSTGDRKNTKDFVFLRFGTAESEKVLEKTQMRLPRGTTALFVLNLLDAVLTIYWVRHGFASEANHLMAGLLEVGDIPFLTVKTSVGGLAAFVFFRWSHLAVARFGVTIALSVYMSLMVVHVFTGLTAFGFISHNIIHDISAWSREVLAG